MAVAFVLCLFAGCGHELDISNNEAVKMRDDGVYDVRYALSGVGFTDKVTGEVVDRVSINVNQEMDEKDMLKVLEYYELVHNAEYSVGGYEGERDEDYTCYAVFYDGDTDNEITKIKYFNHEKVEITDEDKGYFPPPYLYIDTDE